MRVVYRSRHPPNGSLNASKGDARARPRLPTASGVQADRIAWRRSNRKPRESGASLGPVRRLVIADTIVIAMPLALSGNSENRYGFGARKHGMPASAERLTDDSEKTLKELAADESPI